MSIDEVLAENSPKIKKFLSSKLSNPNDVEDLLQDILIKVYLNINSVRSNNKINAWAMKIARNSAADYYRKPPSKMEGIEDIYDMKNNTESREDLYQCIIKYIGALPFESQKLILAIDFDGRSQKEYAKFYDINYSTLRSRVQDIRQHVYSQLTHCCSLRIDTQGKVLDCKLKNKLTIP